VLSFGFGPVLIIELRANFTDCFTDSPLRLCQVWIMVLQIFNPTCMYATSLLRLS
jgi:hypothetical protein